MTATPSAVRKTAGRSSKPASCSRPAGIVKPSSITIHHKQAENGFPPWRPFFASCSNTGRLWYNSCKSSYYTDFMAGRSAGDACSRPIGQLYHSALLHGIIAAKQLLYSSYGRTIRRLYLQLSRWPMMGPSAQIPLVPGHGPAG